MHLINLKEIIMTELKLIQIPENRLEGLLLEILRKHDRQRNLLKENEFFFTKKQAQNILGMSYNTLMKHINSGGITPRPDGRISQSEIDRFNGKK